MRGTSARAQPCSSSSTASLSVAGGVDGIALGLEPAAQEVRDEGFVLDDQDVHVPLQCDGST
jgi:hypothetical protein